MTWIDWVPSPESRQPLTVSSFTLYVLPALLSYYVSAVLVCLPNTQPLRIAVLPAVLWMVFRAAINIDLAPEGLERVNYLQWNHCFATALTTISMRVSAWAFQSAPLRRLRPTAKSEPSESISIKQACLDAGDLVFNLRGIGWNWSAGLRIPPDWRATSSPSQFFLQTLGAFVLHVVGFDIAHHVLQYLSLPSPVGTICRATIFDPSLPPAQRYLRSSFMSFLAGMCVYCSFSSLYHFNTMIGLLVFRQQPDQWPPFFYRPWFATSLNDFWAKRWHQAFRDSFMATGGRLLLILGRPGAIMGVFFMSGLLHHFGSWGIGCGTDFASIGGFFLLMGIGVVLEGLWKKVTGARVDSWAGWLWTMVWIIGGSHSLVNAWVEREVQSGLFIPKEWSPAMWMASFVRSTL